MSAEERRRDPSEGTTRPVDVVDVAAPVPQTLFETTPEKPQQVDEVLARQFDLVSRFARAMKDRLEQKRWRGDWQDQSVAWACVRLMEECGELAESVLNSAGRIAPAEHVLDQAADVGNFAMIVHDRYTRWASQGPVR